MKSDDDDSEYYWYLVDVETIVSIRSKKVKGIDYAYLVRTVRNPKMNFAR